MVVVLKKVCKVHIVVLLIAVFVIIYYGYLYGSILFNAIFNGSFNNEWYDEYPIAYGEGVVLSAKPMGNDTLLEIAFADAGTKKIMANYAKVEKK